MNHSNLLTFVYDSKPLRILVDRDEPVFLAKDVLSIIDINDKQKAMKIAYENRECDDGVLFYQVFVNEHELRGLHYFANYEGMLVLWKRRHFLDNTLKCQSEHYCDDLLDKFSYWIHEVVIKRVNEYWDLRVQNFAANAA